MYSLKIPAPNLVNFALWTVSPEILCYIIMALMIVRGVHRNRRIVLAITLLYAVVCILSGIIQPPVRIAEVLPTKALVYAFLVGNCLYLYRDVIPYSKTAGGISFVGSTALIYVGQQLTSDALSYFAVPGYVYALAVVGLSRLPALPLLSRGDYSYGVYIYGWPIQQAVAHFLPNERYWWINFGIALPSVLACAIASWHFIEKPVLGFKKSLYRASQEEFWSPRKRLIVTVAIGIYGIAIVDATSLLPLRALVKAALQALGMY